jgi:hypothetical protein
MRFLCTDHRRELNRNPKQAAKMWQELISQGRKLFHLEHWEQAVMIYGNAFEVSEILISNSQTKYSIDRYLRTALEFAYVLRKSQTPCNLNAFLPHVKKHLSLLNSPQPLSHLLQPINEVVTLPIHMADFWLRELLSLDNIEQRILH